MTKISIDNSGDTTFYRFECPHCYGLIEVELQQVNCGIFRHGIFKNTGEFVPPHSTKSECDEYVYTDIIFGCCKPFKIKDDNAEICDYI
jgi:hypothetical protein